jgi:hypothetical protein
MREVRDMFWIVWCPTGTKPPSYRHPTYESAVAEAERLARCSGTAEFYVMASETMRKVDSMQRIDFDRPMPF